MEKRDVIFLEAMTFFGYHGVLDFEGEFGQPFIIDAYLETTTQKAGLTDELTYSTHYGEVFETIQDVVENERFQLLEALAEQIAAQVLANYPLIEAVTIKVNKPHAPIRGNFKNVGVKIYRER
ncbi:MAG: dihydroneopterin aldolase [Culicoidibacterales bacterium]